MSSITESIDVQSTVHTTYNQWTQFESFPEFMAGVEEVRQVSDTKTHWVTKIAGVTREFDATITEQLPDERVSWRSDSGPTHAGVITFHRLDDAHTRVTAQMDLDPEGFVENVADKLGVLNAQVKSDLKKFKEFIESRGGRETGAWRGSVDRPGSAPQESAQPSTAQPSTAQPGTAEPGSFPTGGAQPGDFPTGGGQPGDTTRPGDTGAGGVHRP
jgi:uncharacterized membrane protein